MEGDTPWGPATCQDIVLDVLTSASSDLHSQPVPLMIWFLLCSYRSSPGSEMLTNLASVLSASKWQNWELGLGLLILHSPC